jgi:hypothetical protein
MRRMMFDLVVSFPIDRHRRAIVHIAFVYLVDQLAGLLFSQYLGQMPTDGRGQGQFAI